MSSTETEILDTTNGISRICFMREWARMEQQAQSGIEPIDLEMAPAEIRLPKALKLTSREQIAETLRWLRIGSNTGSEFGEYLSASLDSSLAFIGALNGNRLSLEDYIRGTMATGLPSITTTMIESQFSVVSDIFKELGYSFGDVGFRHFQHGHRYTMKQGREKFEAAQTEFEPIIKDAIGNNLKFEYDTKFVDVKKPWINSVSGGPERYLYRVNLFSGNRNRNFEGMDRYLTAHEIFGGHLTQALYCRRDIQSDKLPVGYGITSIPGVEQPVYEGAANNVHLLVPELGERLGLAGLFAFEHTYLRDLVLGLVHLMVNDPNTEPLLQEKMAKEIIQTWLPSELEESIPTIIELRRNDPKYRSYFLSYAIGDIYFRNIIPQLGCENINRLFIRTLEHPQTIGQLSSKVEQELLAAA